MNVSIYYYHFNTGNKLFIQKIFISEVKKNTIISMQSLSLLLFSKRRSIAKI